MSSNHIQNNEITSAKKQDPGSTISSSQIHSPKEDTSANMPMTASHPLMNSNLAPREAVKKENASANMPVMDAHPLLSSKDAPPEDVAPTLGERATKPMLPQIHLVAVLVSLSCLVMGICTVVPSLSLAWHLEFSGQIIVIGFLLSIMNLYMQTILSTTFLLLETRFG